MDQIYLGLNCEISTLMEPLFFVVLNVRSGCSKFGPSPIRTFVCWTLFRIDIHTWCSQMSPVIFNVQNIWLRLNLPWNRNNVNKHLRENISKVGHLVFRMSFIIWMRLNIFECRDEYLTYFPEPFQFECLWCSNTEKCRMRIRRVQPLRWSKGLLSIV